MNTASATALVVGAVTAWLAASSLHRGRYRRMGLRFALHFLGSLLTTLFPLQVALLVLLGLGISIHVGALSSTGGLAGIALACAGLSGLALQARRAAQAESTLRHTLHQARVPKDRGALIEPWRMLRPLHSSAKHVERLRNLPYGPAGERNLLDLYRDRRQLRSARLPVLLQVHGSAWMISSKDHQAQPLMHHMALNGWICVAINYRLSPAAKFPDHLIDVKRAIAWIRTHIAGYGGDPDFICVTGGSAGGHLASLAALTPQRKDLQPGFETLDTSVFAAVPIYGRYDFLDRDDVDPNAEQFRAIVTRYIMPGPPEAIPDLWELASPIGLVHSGAPPFFIVHTVEDLLIPVESARAFAVRLKEFSRAPVLHAELRGLQHGYDLAHSPATEASIHAIRRFLNWQYSRFLEGTPDHESM